MITELKGRVNGWRGKSSRGESRERFIKFRMPFVKLIYYLSASKPFDPRVS